MSTATFVIPRRVRRGVLKLVGSWTATSHDLVVALQVKVGFDTVGELIEAIGEKHGDTAVSEFHTRFDELLAASVEAPHHVTAGGVSSLARLRATDCAEPVLLCIPDSMFAAAVEVGYEIAVSYAFDLNRAGEAGAEIRDGVENLFIENGVPWGWSVSGQLVPTGSRALAVATTAPAMDVLDDPRLGDARKHLAEAQRRLQEPDTDEAVDEARMAVEYRMLAVLDAHDVSRPARHQPNDLFDALAQKDGSGVLARDALELVLAAPRFRGRTSAGHAGRATVTVGEAQAVVGAAAAAIVYLADKLP